MSAIIWPFLFIMSKKNNSLKLCSMVNFFLGCRFFE